MTSIKLAVDHDAEMAYITLSENDIAKTVEHNECILIDMDALDVVVGVELLDLDAEIPFTELTTRYHVDSHVVDVLRTIQPTISKFMFSYKSTAKAAEESATPVATDVDTLASQHA